jgi:hypothetical protein
MTLTSIVKSGENFKQHKNQPIGLFGLTQKQKDGVTD